MAVIETAQQSSAPRAPIYREIAAPASQAGTFVDGAGRVLGSTSDVGLCPACGAERLAAGNENAMPLFVAGAALGVMSIPFMLVTFVGVIALISAIPMMLAPLMMNRTADICPKCQST